MSGRYLRLQQERGAVAAGVDVEVVGLEVLGSAFVRAFTRHMLGKGVRVPDRDRTAASLAALLAPRD